VQNRRGKFVPTFSPLFIYRHNFKKTLRIFCNTLTSEVNLCGEKGSREGKIISKQSAISGQLIKITES